MPIILYLTEEVLVGPYSRSILDSALMDESLEPIACLSESLQIPCGSMGIIIFVINLGLGFVMFICDGRIEVSPFGDKFLRCSNLRFFNCNVSVF